MMTEHQDHAGDPNMVLEHFSKLNVRVDREIALEQVTPEETPSSVLGGGMREWLDDALGSGGPTSSPNLRLYTKLLVSNVAAGSVIGKAGGNINEFQAETSCRIQLSKSGEYYPGTAERTLLISGRLKQIIAAISLVFDKLQREGVAPVTPRSRSVLEAQESDNESNPSIHLSVKLLVPQPLCGIIIGKGGSTIKNYAADTQTQIKVTAPDGPVVQGLNHRVVLINGHPEGCLKAIALLTLKQAEDPKYQMYSELPMSYITPLFPTSYIMPNHHVGYTAGGAAYITTAAASPPATTGLGPIATDGRIAGGPGGMFTASPDGTVTYSFFIPDDQAAIMIGQGRGSGGIEDIQMASGAKIRMELGRERPEQTSTIAQVFVVGSMESVQYANYLIMNRLALGMVYHQQYIANHGVHGHHVPHAGPYYPTHHQHHLHHASRHHQPLRSSSYGVGNGNSSTNNNYNNNHYRTNGNGIH